MNKLELSQRVSDKFYAQHHKQAPSVSHVILEHMSETLQKGLRVEVRNFWSWTVKVYNKYVRRTPKTGELLARCSYKRVKFKSGRELRYLIDKAEPPPLGILPEEPVPLIDSDEAIKEAIKEIIKEKVNKG